MVDGCFEVFPALSGGLGCRLPRDCWPEFFSDGVEQGAVEGGGDGDELAGRSLDHAVGVLVEVEGL